MNPEAVEWLESLDEEQHLAMFTPFIPFTGELFTLRPAHESSRLCLSAGCYLKAGER